MSLMAARWLVMYLRDNQMFLMAARWLVMYLRDKQMMSLMAARWLVTYLEDKQIMFLMETPSSSAGNRYLQGYVEHLSAMS